MIIYNDSVLEFIEEWTGNYAKTNGKSLLVNPERNANAHFLNYVCDSVKAKFNIEYRVAGSDYLEACKIADSENGLVLSGITRTYSLYYRMYSKMSEGLADLFPFFDLEDSEQAALEAHIWPERDPDSLLLTEQSRMLEFCNSTNALYHIITNDEPPQNNPRWPYFTAIQKRWIADVHFREKKTRHKVLTKPYPILPCHLIRRI